MKKITMDIMAAGGILSLRMNYYFVNEDGSIAKEDLRNAVLCADLVVRNGDTSVTYTRVNEPATVVKKVKEALEKKGVVMVALDGEPEQFDDWESQLAIEMYE